MKYLYALIAALVVSVATSVAELPKATQASEPYLSNCGPLKRLFSRGGSQQGGGCSSCGGGGGQSQGSCGVSVQVGGDCSTGQCGYAPAAPTTYFYTAPAPAVQVEVTPARIQRNQVFVPIDTYTVTPATVKAYYWVPPSPSVSMWKSQCSNGQCK